MVQVLEKDAAAKAITATINYIADNGEKIFTVTAGPGGTDVRNGGALDPRPVAIHDGRPQAQRFELERDGFQFYRRSKTLARFVCRFDVTDAEADALVAALRRHFDPVTAPRAAE